MISVVRIMQDNSYLLQNSLKNLNNSDRETKGFSASRDLQGTAYSGCCVVNVLPKNNQKKVLLFEKTSQ